MRRESSRRAPRCAAGRMPLALLCLAALRLFVIPAGASTVQLHYEDAFEDVLVTEQNEAEIKAAFLLRFPDFVSWRRSPGDTLRIGVTGDDALLAMLQRLAEQENRLGLGAPRIVAILPVSGPETAQRCEILVLGGNRQAQLEATLAACHRAGTLTVGVWNEARTGAVIRLFREGNRIRFDISQTLAKEAGLQISSKLLNLAREQSQRVVPDRAAPARG